MPPGTAVPPSHFSIVFLPDTHVEAWSDYEWQQICRWISDNRDRYAIAAIVGEGDVITNAADPAYWSNEFVLARVGWDQFDAARIPNVAAIGNHDYDTDASVTNRNSTRFDGAFPLSRMSGRAWYGGAMAASSKNSWIKFNCGNRKFLILSLEIWPDDAMLTWGLGVCNANLDRDVILVTHSHQNLDGTLTASTDQFGMGSPSYAANDGPGVWAKLGKLAPNMKFIVSGHQYGTEPFNKTAYLLGTGDNGNRVHQWFCNYQTVNSGDSMIGLLRFPMNGSSTADLFAYKCSTNTPDPASVLSLTW